MAVSFTITRKTSLFQDVNGDGVKNGGELDFIDLNGNGVKDAGEANFDLDEAGVFDPGDTLYTRVTITNTGDQSATGLTIADNFAGSTLVSGTLNISPIAFNDNFTALGNTVLRVGTVSTINGGESTFVAGSLLANDVGGIVSGFGQGVIADDQVQGFKIDVVTSGTSANGGKFNIFADGTFNYVNDGTDVTLTTDSFTYKIRDAGLDGQYDTYDDLTSTGTATITFALQAGAGSPAHRVWYVDSAAAPGGDGTSANPFQTLATINGVTGDGTTDDDRDQTGEYIYVENSGGPPVAVTGPITLENGQKLIGDGADLIVAGFTLATAGANSTISSGVNSSYVVTVGVDNTIAGLNIVGTGTNTGGINDNQAGSFGTLSLNPAALNAATPGYQSTISATGAAISLSDGAIAGNGLSNTISSGGANNIRLFDITGTLALGGGSMTNVTAQSFLVAGGTVSTTYSGNITQADTSALIDVQGHNGTLTFNSGTLSATAGNGISFNNADGTYNFNGTTTLAGGDAGIDIVNGSTGTFNFTAGTTITSPTGIALRINASDANVTYAGNITQANNAAMVDINDHGGTVTFSGTLNATNGSGLQFSDSDGTYNFNGDTNLNGGDAGIDIDTGSAGTFTFNLNTDITNPTGDAFLVDTSTAAITYAGTITDNSGRIINISNHDTTNNITFTTTSSITATAGSSGILIQESGTGGTIAFNGETQLTTTNQNAVTLINNAGKTINFNADGLGLDITTTSGSGFAASNGGTITISDSGSGNTINVTSAGALSVAAFSAINGTTIGAGGVTFDSISQNGGLNGIVLSGTGTGAFTVLGDGSQTSGLYDRDGSGGTISGTTGHAIALTNANNVTIRQMNLTNPGGDGVNSSGGSSIKLQAVNIDAGGGDGWQAINLGGVNEFNNNSRVTDWQVNNTFGITVTNTDTNFTSFTVQNALFTTSATGADGFLFDANGATSGSITVNNSEFTLIDQDAVQINADGSGTINARVNNNNFHDADATAGDGNNTVFLALAGSGTLNFEVINNDFTNLARGQTLTGALAVNAATTGQTGSRLNGFIEDNVFTNIFRRDAISFVMEANGGVQGTHTIEVDNNSGTNIGLTALRVLINSVAGGSITATNLRYINNTFSNLGTSPLVTDDSRSGIDLETNWDNFASGGDLTTNLLFQNNNITNNGNASGVSDTFDLTNRGGEVGTNGTMNLTMLGNTFTNTGGPHGIDILNSPGTSATGSGATLNLDINSDNISPNNTITTNGAGGAILLRNNTTAGAFRIEDLGATAVATFVSTRNSGDTVTPSGTITSTGDVTMPTAPSAFVVAAAPPPAPPADDEPVGGAPIDTPTVGNGPTPPPPPPAPAPAPVPAGPVVIDDGVLSQAELDLIVDAAITRWAAAGASEAQVAAMRAVSVSVSDLAGLTLGESNAGTIVLDSNAAGWSWFVDPTPGDDSEYAGSGTKLAALDLFGAAGTRIDLLTVLTHELGHQIGLSDLAAPGSSDELMYGTIGAGERRLPGSDDAQAASGTAVAGAFAFAPITLGTLPAGQSVTVEWRHTINNPAPNGLAGSWTGQSTVDSVETSPQTSNAESGAIDALKVGGTIWNDNGAGGGTANNGVKDGSEPGIDGVLLTLFADANNDDVPDDLNAPLLTATTAGGGNYTFSGLAPGNYVVRVDQDNFDAGGASTALVGTQASAGTGLAPDPDNDTDNDDNGRRAPGQAVFGKAITLSYGGEPTVDGDADADSNTTLDFGFRANVAPTVTAADLTVSGFEDTNLVFNAAGLNAITVADPDVGPLTATLTVTNGTLTLASIAGLTVTGNNSATVELTGSAASINAALEGLIYRGGLNYEGSDTLNIEVDDGVLTDTESVAITLADDGFIDGDTGDNVLNGTPQRDIFRVQQGGNDTVNALAGNDSIYFGAAFTAGDTVNGDDGFDVLILQGDYSAGVTFGTGTTSNISGIDSISLFPGSLTTYGDTANNLYSYDLTMLNGNVTPGGVMKINGSGLIVGEDFTFDGSAETGGQFFVYAGKGIDTLTGGGLGDSFVFNHEGRFGLGDTVNGGDGYDVVYLRGDYTIDFNAVGFAGSLTNVESVGLISFADTTQAGGGDGEFDYSIIWNNAMLTAVQTITFNGSRLGANETMQFDGTAEASGSFRLWGGAAADVLRGGGGNDLIYGGNGGDTLQGGAGSDIFRYQNTTESQSGVGNFDTILDFVHGTDKIDLSFIDANIWVDGNQAFLPMDSNEFSGLGDGELRYFQSDALNNIWQVEGDTDGNGFADFVILVTVDPGQPLTSSDFVL
jgi:hypothetical protein